jgi:large subunit ribosomal protein L24
LWRDFGARAPYISARVAPGRRTGRRPRGDAVQTTLLGIAIALIVALVAALVGPHYIDWNGFRPSFEAEATRLTGLPVRIHGAIDARLLPSPSLRWRDVTFGKQDERRRLKVRQLDVELSLGSLLRGEWRASEVSIVGVDAAAGLDADGRIEAVAPAGEFRVGPVTIDRFSLTGGVDLHDAASGTAISLTNVAMSGDVRAAASLRGEGTLDWNGARHSLRLAWSRAPEGRGARLRIAVDSASSSRQPLSLDIEGAVAVEAGQPSFDGMMTMTRAAGSRSATRGAVAGLELPWRVSAKVAADPSHARFEKIDALYGAEDSGVRLSGVGDLRLGAAPAFHAAVSARQIDADRMLGASALAAQTPAQMFAQLANAASRLPMPSLPVQLEIGADVVTLAGRPVQGAGVDLRASGTGWTIDRVEFRAPGGGRFSAAGQVESRNGQGAFQGTAAWEASEPAVFLAWFLARDDIAALPLRGVRAKADVSFGGDRIELDGARIEAGGATLDGRIVLRGIDRPASLRAEAVIRGERVDLDTVYRLVLSAGPMLPRPADAQLSLDLKQAVIAAREWRTFKLRMSADSSRINFDELAVGDAAGLSLDASAAFDRRTSAVDARIAARAPSRQVIDAALAPLTPSAGAYLRWLGEGAIDAAVAFKSGPSQGEGEKLVAPVEASLKTGATEFRASGRIEPFAPKGPVIHLGDIAVANADLGPLLGVPRRPVIASLTAAAKLDPPRLVLTDIKGTVADTAVSGDAIVALAGDPVFNGTIALERIDLGSIAAILAGADGVASAEPLRRGMAGHWRGQVDFHAARARLAEGIEAQTLRGTLRGDNGVATLTIAEAALGGGSFSGEMTMRPRGEGLGFSGRFAAVDVAPASLRILGFTLPAEKMTAFMKFESAGRSYSALIGSLAGEGSLKLDAIRLAGLDPRAFALAMDVADSGRAGDAPRLKEATELALAKGAFTAPSAQWTIGAIEGRVRTDNAALDGDGGRVTFSGGVDLASGEADLRGALTAAPMAEAGPSPPGIRVGLKGNAGNARSTADTAEFVRWLTARLIERDTRRLESLEKPANAPPSQSPSREPSPSASPPSPPPSLSQPPPQLPPAVNNPPAPVGQPAASPAPAKRKAPSGVVRQPLPQPVEPPPGVDPAASAHPDGSLPPLPPPIDIRPPPGMQKRQAPRPPAPSAAEAPPSRF